MVSGVRVANSVASGGLSGGGRMRSVARAAWDAWVGKMGSERWEGVRAGRRNVSKSGREDGGRMEGGGGDDEVRMGEEERREVRR